MTPSATRERDWQTPSGPNLVHVVSPALVHVIFDVERVLVVRTGSCDPAHILDEAYKRIQCPQLDLMAAAARVNASRHDMDNTVFDAENEVEVSSAHLARARLWFNKDRRHRMANIIASHPLCIIDANKLSALGILQSEALKFDDVKEMCRRINVVASDA
ncbi:MAG: hypothetical protein JKY27_05325 [Magnetovibrio sp.]|nr:hypothetical protein [Magnetovibrio sp.]